ncbi:MAG: hypothetical protein NTY38_33680, partial [Acidobacteria bacterium]|nr:hypothetical protein [Acidobacteriota bacterium]
MKEVPVILKSRSSLIAAVALAVSAVTPAMAGPVTFAQYFQVNGAEQQWSVSTVGTTTTVSAVGQVLIHFSGVAGLPFVGDETATFTLNATSSQVGNCGVSCGSGDSFVQPGYSGTFSFIDNGVVPGTNLLSGTFAVTGSPATTGAQFSSHVGSSGGSFDGSATLGNLTQLVFTSAYKNFAGATQENASWSLSSLQPPFATTVVVGNQARPSSSLSPFNAAGTGTFSVSSVPEPATLGLVGGALL